MGDYTSDDIQRLVDFFSIDELVDLFPTDDLEAMVDMNQNIVVQFLAKEGLIDLEAAFAICDEQFDDITFGDDDE